MALGLAATVVAIVAGAVLIGVQSVPAPEARGIGVLVEGTNSLAGRGYDAGLTVSLKARVIECGEPVAVTLTVAPTAEFWRDNADVLRSQATVQVAVPDASISGIDVSTATDALAAVVDPQGASTDSDGASISSIDPDKETETTALEITVPGWGRSLAPVVLSFTADWTESRSRLGGCYLSLPALAGHPTVLSGAQLAGTAVPLEEELGTRDANVFEVESRSAGVHAYWNSDYEVTRGVASIDLGDYTLQDATSAAPDTTLAGSPAWTCRTTIPDTFANIETQDPGEPTADFNITGSQTTTVAFSAERIQQILEQRTCATFVAIEAPGAGTKRDLLLIIIGALFSIGMELVLSGVVRDQQNTAA
ncbi:hypothetical protein [Nocardioides psychrotolerans]|uniref:Uncharacterized protein n=1 Tax=Nocardioides psychrotolerans TaxID=1005945 RepID=A0A1I3R2D0_9ACTN|nr:hypothetical protein [Nocardioides psychrotolerans]SFJ40684.1 hypothetical protein SAMN05216561_12926 [Nocardioides psychrotolerans]